MNLVKTERRIEEGIASALTEVEAVEAGLRQEYPLCVPFLGTMMNMMNTAMKRQRLLA